MAISTLPCPSAHTSEFETARFIYAGLREHMNETGAVAHALGMHQEPDTFAYHLSRLLDSMMSESELWNELDKFFRVNNNGDLVEVQHG